mmetsp:Transcript_26161/g.23149  ORF Transcript_26161/g.23149 Transcript_26161/m.23149 type:complete len:201 (+) Transcript_26161:159-761(+)
MHKKLNNMSDIIEMLQSLYAGDFIPIKTGDETETLNAFYTRLEALMDDLYKIGVDKPWESIFDIEKNIHLIYEDIILSEIYQQSAIFRDMNIEEFKEDATKINLFKLEAIEKYKQLREKVRKDAEEHWKDQQQKLRDDCKSELSESSNQYNELKKQNSQLEKDLKEARNTIKNQSILLEAHFNHEESNRSSTEESKYDSK